MLYKQRPRVKVEQETLNIKDTDIVQPYLNLIISISKPYWSFCNTADREDLIQVGLLGLLHGLNKFDASKGVKFSFYVKYWIKVFMNVFLKRNYMIKLPHNKTEKRMYIKRKEIIEAIDNCDQKAIEQLCLEFNVSTIELNQMYYWLKRNIVESYDDSPTEPSYPDSTLDPSNNYLDANQLAYYQQIIQKALEKLSPKERDIFTRLHLQEEKETYASIGKDYGVSQQSIDQLDDRITKRIEKYLKARYVWDPVNSQPEPRKF